MLSCQEDCWMCRRADKFSGYFFKGSDTVRYNFYDVYEPYDRLSDSLLSNGYSQHREEEIYGDLRQTCKFNLKTYYEVSGYTCTEK